ncbi:MAG: hypothetical protein GKC04_00135 [Methanomicrobiales archaeon]|nr:hypothetical protein [Methanomicrobiales archaeon]
MMREPCCLFPVRSGIPAIGLGLFLLLACAVPYFVEGLPPLPLPVFGVFLSFGLLLIAAGLKKNWHR